MQQSLARNVTVSRAEACLGRKSATSTTTQTVVARKATLSARASFGASFTQKLQQNATLARSSARQSQVVYAEGYKFGRPTVTDTKVKFMEAYSAPIPAMYNTVLQELIVECHLNKYNKKYAYSPVLALGFCSVFDQLFSNYKYGNAEDVFNAFLTSIEEDPAQYRADAKALTESSTACSSVDDLAALPVYQAMTPSLHSKFSAIGVFRTLELAGITDPAALQKLVDAASMEMSKVSKDLMTYKGLLSKLESAKAMQEEFLKREKKKTAERLAEKEARAAKEAAESTKEAA